MYLYLNFYHINFCVFLTLTEISGEMIGVQGTHMSELSPPDVQYFVLQ